MRLTLRAVVGEVNDSIIHQKENAEICVAEEKERECVCVCVCVCVSLCVCAGVIHLLWPRRLGYLLGNFQETRLYVEKRSGFGSKKLLDKANKR